MILSQLHIMAVRHNTLWCQVLLPPPAAVPIDLLFPQQLFQSETRHKNNIILLGCCGRSKQANSKGIK
jgi:hypothetical protein